MNHQKNLKIIQQTKDDYNIIASNFSLKREKISDDVYALKNFAQRGDKVLDLGCGSGRLVEVFSDLEIDYLGADNCEEFIKIAREKYPKNQFELIDSADKLPYPNNSFNLVFCLSMLHHIPGRKLQQSVVDEIYRVLKPGGTLVLTTWNLLANYKMRPLLYRQNIKKLLKKSDLNWNDIYFPYKIGSGDRMINRFLHHFSKSEMKNILTKSGLIIEEIGYNFRGKKVVNSNLIVRGRK